MTKIHRIRFYVVGEKWEEVDIAEASIEIDNNGKVVNTVASTIPLHRLAMFKPETRMNFEVKDGEEKKTQD